MFTAVGCLEILLGFELSLEVSGLRPITIKHYTTDARKFLEYYSEVPPLEITSLHIRQYLALLKNQPSANQKQTVISEIMSGVEDTHLDTEKKFLDVIDKVHEIRQEAVDLTPMFTLSQTTKVYSSAWGRRIMTMDSSSLLGK